MSLLAQLLGFIVIFYCNVFFIGLLQHLCSFFVIGAIQIRDDDDDDDDDDLGLTAAARIQAGPLVERS